MRTKPKQMGRCKRIGGRPLRLRAYPIHHFPLNENRKDTISSAVNSVKNKKAKPSLFEEKPQGEIRRLYGGLNAVGSAQTRCFQKFILTQIEKQALIFSINCFLCSVFFGFFQNPSFDKQVKIINFPLSVFGAILQINLFDLIWFFLKLVFSNARFVGIV